jgi:hypothetical protein
VHFNHQRKLQKNTTNRPTKKYRFFSFSPSPPGDILFVDFEFFVLNILYFYSLTLHGVEGVFSCVENSADRDAFGLLRTLT